MENKKEIKKERQDKKELIKKIRSIIVWAFIVGVVGYGVFWVVTLPKLPDSEIISENGIHSHANISIKIKGKEIEVPANIGIGAVHNPMHTHDPDGTVHMEYGGVVRGSDTLVGRFFDAWGKDFSSEGVMGNINGKDGVLKMTVNGVENSDFEKYSMKDGDAIEITFE